MKDQKGDILIYQNQQGSIKIDVRLDDETVWLNQNQLCELFQKSTDEYEKFRQEQQLHENEQNLREIEDDIKRLNH
ncbi:MAG: hypothetical protein KA206_11300 [Paludibacter sp.]|nr:hypothetical protein [Paludibacter sp.]